MKVLTLILTTLLCWLQYSLWFSKNNVSYYNDLKHTVLKQKSSIAELKILNTQLFAEVGDLNSGFEAIEERARNELGMIKSGEDFFQLVTRQETDK